MRLKDTQVKFRADLGTKTSTMRLKITWVHLAEIERPFSSYLSHNSCSRGSDLCKEHGPTDCYGFPKWRSIIDEEEGGDQ